MKRASIDVAGLAQLERRETLLRDVIRSGGKDRWSHLFTRGHRYATILSAVRSGYLQETVVYEYEITEAGRQYVESTAIPPANRGTEA